MSAERSQRLRHVFEVVLGAEERGRDELLDALCANDPDMRDEVVRLVSAADRTNTFLDSPATSLLTRRLSQGDVLCGRFELIAPLGRGGMGEVWEAKDRQLGEAVAIKTIATNHLGDATSLARFKREIQLARRVSHPNVCRVYDLFEDAGITPPRVFLTMERLEGATLAERLKRDGPIPRAEALSLFRQITAGLAAAHDAGVVHRDLKPANVMLTVTGGAQRAVVMDFGLARAPEAEGGDVHTATGALVGTPEYMAPEQIAGGPATPETDVYALGLLLFEMLSGTRPYAGGTTFESWMRRAREGPRRLSGAIPGVQRRIDDVIARAVQYEPSKRFRDAGAVRKALDSPWPAMVSGTRTPALAAAVLVGATSVILVAFNLAQRLLPGEAPPAEAVQWYRDAQEALAEGASVRALNNVNRAIELAPRFPDAQVALAEIFLELDMPGRAQEAMLRATELTPDRSRLPEHQSAYIDGVQQLLLRNCDASITSLQRVAELATDGDRPYRSIAVARAMERCGRPDEAASMLEQVARLDPRNAAAPLRRARLLARRREYDAAAAALATADALFRDRRNTEGMTEVLATRGTFEAEQDRLQQADQTLYKAAEVARSFDDVRQQVRVLLQQAIVRRKQGNLTAANQLTLEAITLARRENLESLTLDGLFAAANVHVVNRQPSEAQALIERALTIADTYRHEEYAARAHLSLASVFVTTANLPRAEQAISAARPYYERIRHTRNLALADALAGQVRIMRGQYTEAITQFGSAATAAEQGGDREQEAIARENLATAQYAIGRYPEALDQYTRVVELRRAAGRSPVEAYARLNVADLLSRLGRFAEAVRTIASVSEIAPDHADVTSQKELITAAVAFRQGNNAAALAAAVRAGDLARGVSRERTIRAAQHVCLAEAALRRAASATRTCAAMLDGNDTKNQMEIWVETRLAAAEAAWLIGGTGRARDLAREVSVVLDALPEHHERWRLLALMAASNADGSEPDAARARLTRELERLRLQWGEEDYAGWRQRVDVNRLLSSALLSNRRQQQ